MKRTIRNRSLDGIWLFRDDEERKEDFLLHPPRVCFVDYKESVLHLPSILYNTSVCHTT